MARIALGSNVKEGPRRGKVVAHRPKGMVDVQFEDVEWEERRPEASLRRGNPVGPEDVYDPDQEQWRRQVLGVYKTQRGRGQSHDQAKASAFAITQAVQVRDKRRKKGTTEPTAKGRREAKSKRGTADAWSKRQEWELMIGKGRKAGRHRVIAESVGGRTRYYVQPGGRYFFSPEKAEAHAGSLNGERELRVAANPPLRKNWLPAAAAVITIADVGYRAARDRKKKKANPRRGQREPRRAHLPGQALRGGKLVRSLTPDQKAAYDWYEARATDLWHRWMRANEEGDEAMLEYIEGLETSLNNETPVVMEARGVEFSAGKPSMARVYRVWPQRLAAWKKKKSKNPRELSELGGMRRGFASLPSAARHASTRVRALAQDKAAKYIALQEVPPSRKQKFEQLRRALERDMEGIDREFRSLVLSVTEELPGAASGLASDAQRRAEAGMKGEYRRTYGEALLQHERRRAAKRARRSRNPKKKRMKGIARTGIGYAWANIRSAQGAGDYYPPTLMRQFDPKTGESEFLMVFDPGRGRFKRRGNFIRDMIRQSNRQRGLKGRAWKRDKTITNKIFAEATPAGLETAERYVIQHPKSGRGSERDPYRIRDLTKDAHRQIVFVSPRKKEADAKLSQLQGRPKGGEFLGTAGDPIEGWATPSRSRAGWVVKALEDKGITVKVDRGVFEDLEAPGPSKRVVQTGPYQITGVAPRPSIERRRRFFPRSYTLVGAKGPAFSNKDFKSPRAAAGFAVRQYIKSTEEQAHDRALARYERALKKHKPGSGPKPKKPTKPKRATLMQQLEALDVAMPTYKALSEAEAKVRLYAAQLGVQGFDVTEHKAGEGRDEVVTYKITGGASGHKPTIKKKTFTDYTLYGPRGGIVKVQSGNKAALERQRKRDGGRITSEKRTLYSLVRTSVGGAHTVLFSSEDEGAVKAKLAEFETGPTRGQQAKQARDRMASLQQEVDRLKGRMEAGGTPGAPHYTLLAHGPGGSIDFTPEGFVLTGPVGVVKLGLGGEARVEQIWMTKKGRYTLGHPELDWLGALSAGRLRLSPGRAESLQERRKERAESELRAAGKRSPLVKAPSKRRELIAQFQAGLGRQGAREQVYLPDAPRKPRKMSKAKVAAERKRLAEKEAELAALRERKNNPAWVAAAGRGAVASGKWLVTSPTGQKILGNAAAVATYYVGERLMKKGKVSPEVMRYIQARVEKETGLRPTETEVTKALTSIDPNRDKTLTADEVAKVLRKNRRR